MTAVKEYFAASQAPRYSLLFALPLFLMYEALVAIQPRAPKGGEWRNGADVIVQNLVSGLAGPRGPLVFLILLTALGVWLVIKDRRAHPGHLTPWVFGGMLVESAVLAVVAGTVVGALTSQLLRPLSPAPLMIASALPEGLSFSTLLMLSLGAGVWEELLFRVVLVGLLALAGRVVFGWRTPVAAGFAVALGAVIFSLFHYIGPFGDPLQLYSFVFRMIAGLFFSALYVVRGFGITAWTHALYDVLVLVLTR